MTRAILPAGFSYTHASMSPNFGVRLWWSLALAASAAATLASAQSVQTPVPIASGFGAGAYPGTVVVPIVIDTTEPIYPGKAARDGIEGKVLLDALVDAHGKVVDVRITTSAHPLLDEQAMKAVRKWKFLPGKVGGTPVPVVVPMSVTFYTIRDGEKVVRALTNSAALVPFLDDFPPDAVPFTTPGLVLPKVVRQVLPKYTSDAMQRKLQGIVNIEAVVGIDGTVTHTRVVTSLDRGGLDQQALQAARLWRFTPCRLHDTPIPCIIKMDLEFRIH